VLITTLSHFPEMEAELELVGFGYNADLMSDEMEVPWTQTHWDSEFLSSRVPPSAPHSDDILRAFLLSLIFYSFPMGRGIQINECCLQAKNDLI
jgi:hypothetical protein